MLDLGSLNKQQLEAVTSTSQNLRIIAGAGSGKTRVLTYRIAYLIEHFKIKPYEIVAFTFTNKAAKEMKERAIKLLEGTIDNNDLNISTFHAFCAKFLRSEISVLGIPNSFVIIDEEEQKTLFHQIGKELFKYKKRDPELKRFIELIGKFKTDGMLPSDVEEYLEEIETYQDISFDKERLLKIFREYEKRKNYSYYLDFDDLLIYTNKILTDFYDIRIKYVNRYRCILIDEFQDTNDVQYNLIKLLSSTNTMIFAVGDPDQTIYTWRGANQKIILELDKDYRGIKTIVLNENYRSTPSILNSANKLISYNSDRYKKDLFTNNKDLEGVKVKSHKTKKEEGKYIADTIKQLINKKKANSYKDIAVLYRSSFVSLNIELALTKANIPYIIYGGERFYSRMEIKDCLSYIRLMLTDEDDIAFERIINVPKRGIGDKTIERLKFEAMQNNMHLAEYVRNLHRFDSELPGSAIMELNSLFEKIDQVKKELNASNKSETASIIEKFLFQELQYLKHLEKTDNGDARIENVKELINDIHSTFKDPNSEKTLEEYLSDITLLSSQDEIKGIDTVSLMTVHTAKGLEFDYVFIASLNEDVFPSYRNRFTPKDLEEERRIAYVAFTRAKKGLYLTYNNEYVYGSGEYGKPSQFIKEADLKVKQEPQPLFIAKSLKRYRYRFQDDTDDDFDIPTSSDDIIIQATNNIKWNIGDRCFHKTFKNGTVIDISDTNVLTIEFDDFGIKKIQGSHMSIIKLNN